MGKSLYENECPKCGGGPVLQDRYDSQLGEAHCDDCGEQLTKDEYDKVKEKCDGIE